jgi:hypothetical protein
MADALIQELKEMEENKDTEWNAQNANRIW